MHMTRFPSTFVGSRLTVNGSLRGLSRLSQLSEYPAFSSFTDSIAEDLRQAADGAVRMQLVGVRHRRMLQRAAALEEWPQVSSGVAQRQVGLCRQLGIESPQRLQRLPVELLAIEVERPERTVERRGSGGSRSYS